MLCNNLFILHTMLKEPIECEISCSNKVTLSQSDLNQMFFISYDTCELCFRFLKAKLAFTLLFNTVVLKRRGLRILIMTNKNSWQNWDQGKSLNDQEIQIIEVWIIKVWLYYYWKKNKEEKLPTLFYNSLWIHSQQLSKMHNHWKDRLLSNKPAAAAIHFHIIFKLYLQLPLSHTITKQ